MDAGPTLIVGLGNPGREYEGTRHNIGWEVLDRLATRHGVSVTKSRSRALIGQGRVGRHPVLFIKPQTYMNLSGEAVRALMDFYKVPLERVLIVSDDFAIPLGKLRLRGSGSDGGHNGLKSLIQHLGTNAFARLRIGVGPVPEFMDPADFVLGRFNAADKKLLPEIVDRTADAVENYLDEGLDRTMGKYN